MIEKLRKQNDLLIYEYSKIDDQEKLVKQRIIKELLNYDDCFLRLSMEEAYTILKSLGIEDWKSAYAQLLSIK